MSKSRGIVVQHKDTGNVYAISPENINPKTEKKIRNLTRSESIRSFKPFPKNVHKEETSAPVEKDK